MCVLVLSIGGAIEIGIYKDNHLAFRFTNANKTLQALPESFDILFNKNFVANEAICFYDNLNKKLESSDIKNLLDSLSPISAIYYANGPGSFTALKLTHIFLHSISLVKGIKLFATSSFAFCDKPFIKAFGNKYFHIDENLVSLNSIDANCISLVSLDSSFLASFSIPSYLDTSIFHTRTQPLYVLPAV